ncbi:SINGLE-STRANDED DNA-BINDING PROTEIN WHY1 CHLOROPLASTIC [Salix purpurea]|uniref:SINGLE-STRANDED DNA-BINDING PROTEIN WHY1 CHLOROPLASTIC n=1 Tax=Salix purpurea TaxID=77065 RepID=A0A9Q0U9R0_SALPP|nr:SINGLE-STRANDED DNA-BINDING PROTEIN WHY1 CHLOROPLASTIC [Salix purpurea]
MLQLNNVSRVSSTPQNPKLWLLQSNSPCPQKSIAFNSKTSSTEKKKTLGVRCQFYDQQHKNFTTSSRSSPSFAPPGKAALTVEPRSPEFSPLDSGAYKLVKEGFVLLQFAPAAAVRQYDWTRKQVFSLSVTEIGHLGKSEEGKVRKLLKVEPLPDGSGHFFNLSVQNKVLNIDESIYIPVTKAEYTVLTSAFNYILPYLLGWHAYANSIKPDDSSRGNNASPRYGGDHEWNR